MEAYELISKDDPDGAKCLLRLSLAILKSILHRSILHTYSLNVKTLNALIRTLQLLKDRILGKKLNATALNLAVRAFKQQEFTIARQLLKPYAESGYLRAQQCMAMMCLNGLGGPADVEQAKKWFEMAANQGDKASRARLKRLAS